MNKQWMITALIALVVGAGAFFGGTLYQKAQVPTVAGARAFQAGQFGQRGMFGQRGRMGSATVGKIVSVDANSVTVQLADGSSKLINLGSTTNIVQTTKASVSDLTMGTAIAVFGTTNSEGSITAENIQINPALRRVGISPTPGK